MKNEQVRKNRRTKKQIEVDIMEAMERLVAERGFMNIPLLTLVKEADIDPNVIYRNYGSVSKLFELFAGRYDFWLNETLNISHIHTLGDKGFFASALKELFKNLQENTIMQKLLIWELSDVNDATRKTTKTRDNLNATKLAYYESIFQESNIDISTLIALLIGGIYYIVLHEECGDFCRINFSSAEGQKRLNNIIDTITNLVFEKIEQKEKLKCTVVKMEADNIPHNKICKYLGITPPQLSKLLKESQKTSTKIK